MVGPLALPLVLWWIGSFFLRGDLGLWMDDYGFHLRDPATDTFDRAMLFVPPQGFWRPLHMVVTQDLITLTWHKQWLMHGLCAAAHALNVVLLYLVLRRLGIRRTVAGVCGLLFLTLPMAYEVIFWPSTISTAIGLAIFQGALLMFIGTASRAEWGSRHWARMALLAPIMFAIGCWYEQVLTMISCLPFIYVAAAPRLARLREHVVRLLGSVGLAMTGGMVYGVLLATTAGPGVRGGKASYTSIDGMGDKAVLIARQAWGRLALDGFMPGAVRTGWETLGRDWKVGVGAVILLMLSAAAWLAWRWRLISEEQSGVGIGVRNGPGNWWRPVLIMLGGLVVFVLAWLPGVVIQTQWASPRMCYVPVYGAMLVVGALLELAAGCVRWPRAQRAVLMFAGVLSLQVSVTGAIALVGVQKAHQKRYQMDQEQLGVLKRLVPDPPPDTVFMPVKLEDWPTSTGSWRFDTLGRGFWENPWSATYGVRQAYRNKGLHAFAINRWIPLPVEEVNKDTFVYSGPRFYEPHQMLTLDGKVAAAWSTVAAFAVDGSHQLRLVEVLVFKRKGVEIERVELPLVMEAKRRASGGTPGSAESFIREFVVELGG